VRSQIAHTRRFIAKSLAVKKLFAKQMGKTLPSREPNDLPIKKAPSLNRATGLSCLEA